MSNADIKGKKVAILVAEGFEQVELTQPRDALQAAGAQTEIVSLKSGTVQGLNHIDMGDKFPVDRLAKDARADDYDALLLPGGAVNPDLLRIDEDAMKFVKAFYDAGKPIASICHGPWSLSEIGVVGGLKMTSWPSLQHELKQGGAEWVDQEVVSDRGIVTSRNPQDIPAFNEKMIEVFAEGDQSAKRK
ncbi:type 1 glutamine amidotransferase domain-containing protein [Deinococcus sp. UYEF24]